MSTNSDRQTFHLGICMAGAITAGSYTAGIIDYLLETMARWQEQKDKNNDALVKGESIPFPDIPMHDVVIDVISGASAGGMCAAITTAMLAEGIDYRDLAAGKSKMKRAWIDLDDEEIAEGTIKKMLETDDIKKEGLVSILNSKVLSRISEKTVSQLEQTHFPNYVDSKLDTILTLANLRGAKYHVYFRSYNGLKKHTLSLHRDLMHFKVNTTPDASNDFLQLKFGSLTDIQLLRESAVATGAFPIGLRARSLSRDQNYYYNKANRIVGLDRDTEISQQERNIEIKVDQPIGTNTYTSMNIDGGTFNNEPFGEAERILNKKAGKKSGEDIEYHNTNRSILMIDPFPTPDFETTYDEKDATLTHVAPRIISALRSQSSFNAKDIIDAYSDNNYLKYLIIPSKTNVPEPLCCATLSAFGGFLYKPFREHDYQLGKRNAQRFLHNVFVMPFDPNDPAKNNPIHRNWSAKSVNEFGYKSEIDGKFYLPIIPDVQRKTLTIESPIPKKYPISKLRDLEKPLEKRIKAVMDHIEYSRKNKPEEEKSEAVTAWYKQNIFVRILKSTFKILGWPLITTALFFAKGAVAKSIHKACITWILKDLENAGLLDADS